MNWQRVQALASTPRAPSPQLLALMGNRSTLYGVGCALIALAAVLLVGSAVGAFFSWYALAGVLLALLLGATGAAAMFFSRGKGRALAERDAAHLPLVLVGVLQANESLFRPEGSFAGAVLVYTLEPSRGLDHEWLARVLANLSRVKNEGSPDPAVAGLVQALWDPQSLPDETLPSSLTEGVPAHLYATAVNAEKLPGGRIPDHRMIPALLDDRKHPILLPGDLWA